ncbi:MAG: amino acid ABC transporter permease [Nitriliruptoraceae bacterium]
MAAATDASTTAVPPVRPNDPVVWVRRNLFASWPSALATLILAPAVVVAVVRGVRFLFVDARWEIVRVNLALYLVGPFPRDQIGRLWVALAVLAVALGAGAGAIAATARETAEAAGRPIRSGWGERVRRAGPPVLLVLGILAFASGFEPVLLTAGALALGGGAAAVTQRLTRRGRRFVPTLTVLGIVASLAIISRFGGVPATNWGGLLITMFYTIGALLLAFPIGILFALGRRSTLPVVRWGCTAYVEFFRGSPLITLLFVGWLILPFFLPPDFPTPGLVTRALIIFVFFTSAYVAEIVRGGLQAVGRGQREAAQALGLTPWKQTRLVILPQALRAVIPGLVGQAISLFKDTTLVLIIGQSDLLAVARSVTKQDEFLGKGYIVESLAFVAIVYWVISYWMSRESQRLEARLGVGTR